METTMLWGRRLAIVTAFAFVLSSAFPVIACLVKDTASVPKWFGILDVCLAFVLAILALAVMAIAQKKIEKQDEAASYRAYRILLHGILILTAVFLFAGDRITWENCLPGFAWRAWLLLYLLPYWYAAIRVSASA